MSSCSPCPPNVRSPDVRQPPPPSSRVSLSGTKMNISSSRGSTPSPLNHFLKLEEASRKSPKDLKSPRRSVAVVTPTTPQAKVRTPSANSQHAMTVITDDGVGSGKRSICDGLDELSENSNMLNKHLVKSRPRRLNVRAPTRALLIKPSLQRLNTDTCRSSSSSLDLLGQEEKEGSADTMLSSTCEDTEDSRADSSVSSADVLETNDDTNKTSASRQARRPRHHSGTRKSKLLASDRVRVSSPLEEIVSSLPKSPIFPSSMSPSLEVDPNGVALVTEWVEDHNAQMLSGQLSSSPFEVAKRESPKVRIRSTTKKQNPLVKDMIRKFTDDEGQAASQAKPQPAPAPSPKFGGRVRILDSSPIAGGGPIETVVEPKSKSSKVKVNSHIRLVTPTRLEETITTDMTNSSSECSILSRNMSPIPHERHVDLMSEMMSKGGPRSLQPSPVPPPPPLPRKPNFLISGSKLASPMTTMSPPPPPLPPRRGSDSNSIEDHDHPTSNTSTPPPPPVPPHAGPVTPRTTTSSSPSSSSVPPKVKLRTSSFGNLFKAFRKSFISTSTTTTTSGRTPEPDCLDGDPEVVDFCGVDLDDPDASPVLNRSHGGRHGGGKRSAIPRADSLTLCCQAPCSQRSPQLERSNETTATNRSHKKETKNKESSSSRKKDKKTPSKHQLTKSGGNTTDSGWSSSDKDL